MVVIRFSIKLPTQLDDIGQIQVKPEHLGTLHAHAAAVKATTQVQNSCPGMRGDKLEGILVSSRALNKPLPPQAAAAGRQNIPKTIFQVRLGHFTTVAERARRKVEILKALAQVDVTGGIPQAGKAGLMDRPH